MGPNGQLLIENGERDYSKPAHDDSGSKISKSDLFSCGVAAKITGVEGRGTGDFSLIVEGVTRVKVEKIYQMQPYFEGKVTYLKDKGKGLLLTSGSRLPFSPYPSTPSSPSHRRGLIY